METTDWIEKSNLVLGDPLEATAAAQVQDEGGWGFSDSYREMTSWRDLRNISPFFLYLEQKNLYTTAKQK